MVRCWAGKDGGGWDGGVGCRLACFGPFSSPPALLPFAPRRRWWRLFVGVVLVLVRPCAFCEGGATSSSSSSRGRWGVGVVEGAVGAVVAAVGIM